LSSDVWPGIEEFPALKQAATGIARGPGSARSSARLPSLRIDGKDGSAPVRGIRPYGTKPRHSRYRHRSSIRSRAARQLRSALIRCSPQRPGRTSAGPCPAPWRIAMSRLTIDERYRDDIFDRGGHSFTTSSAFFCRSAAMARINRRKNDHLSSSSSAASGGVKGDGIVMTVSPPGEVMLGLLLPRSHNLPV